MTPEVSFAIDELKAAFPDSVLTTTDLGDGGASVLIAEVCLGQPYAQPTSWLGFIVSFQYPLADVYPLFAREDLSRCDGSPLGEGMSIASFDGRAAVQISRRSNRLDPKTDTAVLKVTKVLDWMRSR
jgi:hypothetical protein